MTLSQSSAERRRFRRVALADPARVYFDGRWHDCILTDISGSGVSLCASAAPNPGCSVLFQMRGLGILKATVAHVFEDGMALTFEIPDGAADGLVDNLTLRVNRHLIDGVSEPTSQDKTAPGQVRSRFATFTPRQLLGQLQAAFGFSKD